MQNLLSSRPTAFATTAFVSLCLVLPISAHSGAQSHAPIQATVSKTRRATASTSKVAPIQPARIGDAVPPLTLYRVLNNTSKTSQPAQKPWNSRDLLGWHSLALVVAGRNFSSSWISPLTSVASGLVTRKFDFAFVVSPTQAVALKTASIASTVPCLLDPNSTVASRFGLEPSISTLLLIDRAGILRRVQPLRSANDLSTAFAQMQDPTPIIAEGQPAPDFRVLDMNGKSRRLGDYRGRDLLLTFFPKCFTGGCTVHLSSLRDEYSKLQAANIDVLAVSVDAADGVHGQKAFAKHLNLPFALVPDTGRNLSILYGAANSPDQLAARISVLIDKDSVVRWIDKQINLKTHGADVLAKAHELGVTANK